MHETLLGTGVQVPDFETATRIVSPHFHFGMSRAVSPQSLGHDVVVRRFAKMRGDAVEKTLIPVTRQTERPAPGGAIGTVVRSESPQANHIPMALNVQADGTGVDVPFR